MLADDRRARCAVWGVLVAQQAATVENGLVTYLEHRQRPWPAHDGGTATNTTRTSVPAASRDYAHLVTLLSVSSSASLSTASCRAGAEHYLPHTEASTDASDGTALVVPPETVLVPLSGDMTSIGRLASNDVPLTTNPCVSGVHCSLSLIAGATGTTTTANTATTTTATTTTGAAEASQAHQAVCDFVSHLVGDAAAEASTSTHPVHPAPQGKEDGERTGLARHERRVRVSDYSTNSCLINGQKIGKGQAYAPLASGDVVDLMNAGPRHTAEYNLQFVYYHADDFLAKLATEGCDSTTSRKPTIISTATSSTVKTEASLSAKLAQQARRRALLARAQWNILAQVYRMYHHDVEDFYALDKAAPLGVGGFGKVYRGTLKAVVDNTTSTTTATPSSLLSRAALARRLKELAPTPALYLSETGKVVGAEEEAEEAAAAALRKTTYVQLKAQEAPASVVSATTAVRGKRARSPPTSTPAPFQFAVKLVNKQRLLLQALAEDDEVTDDDDDAVEGANEKKKKKKQPQQQQQQQQQQTSARPAGNGSVAVQLTETDRHTLRRLVQLETQQEDYAAQRERELRDAVVDTVLHRRQRQRHREDGEDGEDSSEEGRAREASFLFGSLSQSVMASLSVADSLEAEWLASASPPPPKTSSPDVRAQRRDELLSRLSPQLRRFYQKELQQKRRQQCEINILLAVHHPCIARLYEVFDCPSQLALVMEQAAGGEVWDLLQPPKRSEPAASGRTEDVEGLSAGGPLPEFVVKMLMVQVLEAVHYLHSMGIVHRDLKLENLLLLQPCRVASLCALQLNVMRQRLQDTRRQASTAVVATATAPATATAATGTSASSPAGGRVAIANPLSLLHTVHVPRAMWPTVKVTDFGLSHVMGPMSEKRKKGPRQGDSGGGSSSASSAALVYARNDMTTSCGTPIYAAPEVVNPQLRPDRVGYSAAVDMYSVGVIAFALLTGRAPFPSRQRAGHGPVVDYTAPLTFERYRKVRPPAPGRPITTEAAPGCAVALPPLACVEEINVDVDDVADGGGSATSLARQWERDVWALGKRIAVAEQRHRQSHQPSGEASPAPSVVGHVFDALLGDTVKALDDYSAARAQAAHDLDLDRFVWHAMQRQVGDGAPGAAAAGVADTSDKQFALPPISLMGQDFLRALLLARPTERLTARQALEHPWLRDCVSPDKP